MAYMLKAWLSRAQSSRQGSQRIACALQPLQPVDLSDSVWQLAQPVARDSQALQACQGRYVRWQLVEVVLTAGFSNIISYLKPVSPHDGRVAEHQDRELVCAKM